MGRMALKVFLVSGARPDFILTGIISKSTELTEGGK